MTREQFLLLKLSEECAEVSQRALKQIQFGAEQVWKGGEVSGGSAPTKGEGLTNAQRLEEEELVDLTILVELLVDAGQLGNGPQPNEYEELKKKKIEKLNKYLKFSNELGAIPEGFKV